MSRTERQRDAQEVQRRLGGIRHYAADQVVEAMRVFAPLGWAMSGVWPVAGTKLALRAASQGAAADEIDGLLTKVWNEQHHRWFDWGIGPLRAAGKAHRPFKQDLWRRASLIEAAIRHHHAGHYEASIPILFAQIEGLSFDMVGKPFFSKRYGVPAVDDDTLAGMGANLEVARHFYRNDVKTRQSEGSLSRHGVLHGRELTYDTLVNSTKVLALTLSVVEHWKSFGDRAALRLRAEHEETVAGQRGSDSDGRLIDDRELPELRDARSELEGRFMEWIMFGQQGVFDVTSQVARVIDIYRLDDERSDLHEDGASFWWSYELPGGHVLGWAARVVGRHRRPPHDSWWWDASVTPEGAPWSESRGWHPGDKFPIPINWEPDLII